VDGPKTSSCIHQAQQHGLKVLGSANGLLVVSANVKEAGSRSQSENIKDTIATIQAWPGVQHVEEDQPRYLQRALLDSATAQQGFPMECSTKDKAMSTSMMPEYMPYGIAQIQADSAKLPRSIDKSGVMVCIIDSGIDASHPDLQGNTLDGCKYEDAFAPGGCPFKWTEDYISHGTHVAGTIAAKKDDQGLVGVIPEGAELYVVRVFNDSGDVNQGQGLVYGSTLILAFTQCEGRLAAMQVGGVDRFTKINLLWRSSFSLGVE
jgi:subtilisin family serine protease